MARVAGQSGKTAYVDGEAIVNWEMLDGTRTYFFISHNYLVPNLRVI